MVEGTEETQPGLRVGHARHGPAVVVDIAGDLDMTTVVALRTELRAALAAVAAPAPVVLDLTAVGFLGSAGLSALTEAHQLGEAPRTPLRLVATHRQVLRPIQLTGLGS